MFRRATKPWLSGNGYMYILADGRQMPYHRYLMIEYLGRKLDRDEHIDHINGNRLDNRIENLRICSNRQNLHYFFGITEIDEDTILKRLEAGLSYRRAMVGTNIKSTATVNRIAREAGLA